MNNYQDPISKPEKSPRTIRDLLEIISDDANRKSIPEEIPCVYLLVRAVIKLLDDGYSVDQDAFDKMRNGDFDLKLSQEYLQKCASHQYFPLTSHRDAKIDS